MVLFILDVTGTFIFALTGALKAVRHRLDWLGILVLSCITGVGGGVLRDLILGNTPPAAFQREIYLISSLAAGVLVILILSFLSLSSLDRLRDLILIGDALGLGVFTFLGALKGQEAGLGPVGILFTGAVTSCGGGLIRDTLVREIPILLRRDFYATASILGSLVYLFLQGKNIPPWFVSTLVILFTTSLRLGAMKFRLSLPVPGVGQDRPFV